MQFTKAPAVGSAVVGDAVGDDAFGEMTADTMKPTPHFLDDYRDRANVPPRDRMLDVSRAA